MPRKRKIAPKCDKNDSKLNDDRNEIMRYLHKVQTDEAYHKKYAEELRQLYGRMEHEAFTTVFILCLKQLMQSDCNQFTSTGLKFMAEFVTSFQAEDMHPLFDSIFVWIFKTVSPTASIRLRLCEFVNQMLNSLPDDGDIEEFHCNEILSYMFDRLKDISPHVRVQAIKALCRLQNRDDPNCEVIQIFRFHLECDPSPLVRQAVISSIARSAHTVPFILERLHDIDVRVRRSVLAHMSNYSLNRCTVDQRLTLIEQGLTDCSEAVRMIAIKIMLPQWLTLCGNDFVAFLISLKLYRNEPEMCRFRKVARMALLAMFRSQDPCNLINVLPLIETNDEASDNDNRFIDLNELTPELSVFWLALIEFFQSEDSYCDHLDRILPDLATICDEIARFSTQTKVVHDKLSSQFILLTLIEILQRLELSDETGRESVKNVIVYLLVHSTCDDHLTESLITICEKLIPPLNSRLQFYVEIVNNILHPIDLDGSLSACKMDSSKESECESLAAKLVQLRERQTKLLETNECEELAALEGDIFSVKEQLLFVISPFLPEAKLISSMERITSENLLRGLKFIFHGVCSKTVSHLNESMYQLYKDIICDRLESENLEIRNWALKCTATFGLLCGKLANDAYHAFCKQLFYHQVKSLWITSIRGIFQLIDRYGFNFLSNNQKNDSKSAAPVHDPLLNVTPMASESLDDNLDVSCTNDEYVPAADVMLLFDRYLDSSQDVDITCELVDGFCMLIVHGRFFETAIMTKLMVMFFNADMEPMIVQILGVFFETLIQHKKQKYLLLSVRETLTAVTVDETLPENNLRSVLRFFAQSMLNETKEVGTNSVECSSHHNDLAVALLTWMDDYSTDRKSLNVISKEILSLRLIFAREESTWNLVELTDNLLDQKLSREIDQNLKKFKKMIAESIFTETLLQFSSTRPAVAVEENDEISFPDDCSDVEPETDVNGNCEAKNNSTDVPIVSVRGKRHTRKVTK